MGIATELRHLESVSALRVRMQSLMQRQPSATQAAFAASCISHGRLYWESAETASIETRPLLLYYGAASFAKALIVAKNACQIGDIHTSHGVSCTPSTSDLVGSYGARANGIGLFQQFNDVVATLNRVHYFHQYNSQYLYTQSAQSSALDALATNVDEILARVPDIAQTYSLCTGRRASLLPLQYNTPHTPHRPHEVRVDLPESFEGRQGLMTHVANIRARAPFLQRWRVGQASHAWNNSIVIFINRGGALEPREFDELDESDDGKSFDAPEVVLQGGEDFEPFATLPALSGGYGGSVALIEDVNGHSLSQYSILLLGLLSLSSLVRYRPHVWTSCVHRRRIADRPIDDQLVPVIEEFLNHCHTAFPKLVADILLSR